MNKDIIMYDMINTEFLALFQLNSPDDNTTLVNLIYFLQERQRRRQTLIDDLSRKGTSHCTALIKP